MNRSGIKRTNRGGGVALRRLSIRLQGDDSRVILRLFFPPDGDRVRSLFERIGALSEEEVAASLEAVRAHHGPRHRDLDAALEENFAEGCSLLGWGCDWSRARRLVAGAYLTMEYAVESAALFNPSIVAHPDQTGAPPGGLRFILSLRATGEGHVSSIVFRTGTIDAAGALRVDPPARLLRRSRIAPDRTYLKPLFRRKLEEMGVEGPVREAILDLVGERFTLADLHTAVQGLHPAYRRLPDAREVVHTMVWLARSNYQIRPPAESSLSELVIFPMSAEESHGIEDLRLVRFAEEGGRVTYFGTYTAFDGVRTLPMLVSTESFRRIEIHSLNGACAKDKGMALFPRRLNGHYAMCSRIDGESLYLMYSDYVHFWESAERIELRRTPWELTLMGNCGSPIETPEGWLLLTHGVGPMRRYCIGAVLLDREDPRRVRGHLREPLIAPLDHEREGYVPNVAYSCGALLHGDRLYLPYALADRVTTFAVIDLPALLRRLRRSR